MRVELIALGARRLRSTATERRRAASHAVLPGVGAYYALTDAFGVLAGVYRGFSPPPPGSDDDVEPEYSVNYEGGARYTRGAARAEVIGFYNDYIEPHRRLHASRAAASTTNLDRQFDAGEARIYGLEAFAELAPLRSAPFTLPLTLAYTLHAAPSS